MEEKRELRPWLETMEIVKNEQVEALGDEVNRSIINLLREDGGKTSREIAREIGRDSSETEAYLSGLEAVGILDAIERDNTTYYVPRARYFTIKTGELPGEEGIKLVQQFLVERVAEMAQELAGLEVEDAQDGTITIDEVNVSPEDLPWIEDRLGQAYREIAEELEERKKNRSGEEVSCRLALFFYPRRG